MIWTQSGRYLPNQQRSLQRVRRDKLFPPPPNTVRPRAYKKLSQNMGWTTMRQARRQATTLKPRLCTQLPPSLGQRLVPASEHFHYLNPFHSPTSFELGTGTGPKPRYIPSLQTLERLGVLATNSDNNKGGNKTKAAQKEKGRCGCQQSLLVYVQSRYNIYFGTYLS